MESFRLLHSHLKVLSYNDLNRTLFVGGFERAFASLFDQDVQTFIGTMLLNLDQLENQLDKEEFQEIRSFNAFRVLMTQFQTFINSQLEFYYDEGLMICKYFLAYTRTEVRQFHDTLIQHMESVKKSIDERAQLKRQYDRRQWDRIWKKQDTSSSSGNYLTHVVDADIRPVNDKMPFAEVQLTAQHNVLANEQQHTEQSEPIYDTYLLEKIDSNTTLDSTNMCHMGGEIVQDAEQYQVKSPLLNVELVKSKEMIKKEKYNELSHRFLLLEKHCISLELDIQQKDASFQSNKPGKNQNAPEFREFFEINDLKAQLQAKTTLIWNLKNQIKSVKEASNEAKVKNDIDVIETINIELEHSVAKLLAANEQLHKENEYLKQTYKELYDSIKKTRVQNKDNSDSLISQINQKWVPTGKIFTDSTTKVNSEPSNGSNDDITNPYECDQTLIVSAVSSLVHCTSFNSQKGRLVVWLIKMISSETWVQGKSQCDEQEQMTSADNTSGPAPQRKEKCTIQDLPRENPLVSVEVLRYDIKRSKSENKRIVPTEMELVLEQTQQEHPSDTKVFTMKMEILLEPTSNKLYGSSNTISEDYIKMEMQIPRSSRVKFIATCSYSRLNDFITSRKNDPKLPQTLISTSSSKDSKIVKGKREQSRSLALKAKKKSSDEESLTSKSEDEEYAMTVRDFKKIFKDEVDSCGDLNHLIGECSKPPRNKNQRAFVGGSWSDSGEDEEEKTKDETCLMA
ncbi:hypothetical protein Tco_0682901 [Tanacetum coccineum]|uniref:Uncharacterized protein n=1 Tax=Tanacetum coccineum TaxID=301880 RepID=A0ABQ4XT43_9ASTR